ncbi:hypothetical protein [Pontibacter ruber]|uniref:Uncharacterized protein n=1 Tax=Pontibacter ruber TaxID=1343895 RepID=A0ABW5D2T5_9BACT|nr:hypothetical protein [Pontibacter ruber]
MRHKLLPFFFFLSIFAAQAQSKFAGKPDEFVKDARSLLATLKSESADKMATDLEALWASGKLSAKQQQEIVDISQRMYRKKMRTKPHFEQFFGMLLNGVNSHNLQGSSLDNMLDVTSKAVQQEDAASLERFLGTSSMYLSSGHLYQNKFYKLKASGGSFSFAYEGGAAPKADDKKAESDNGWDSISWDDEATQQDEEVVDDGWGTIVTPKKTDKKKPEPKKQAKPRFLPAQPKLSGPMLKLDNATLTFVTQYDSTSINKTSGHLLLTRNLFVGEGGTYEWKAGEQPVSAVFRKYNFDISFAGFKVPDVTLTYPSVLAAPVEGAFEFRSTKRRPNGDNGFPRFVSFTNDAKIKSLADNIQYQGGFSLAGNTVGTSSMDGSLSEIVVSHNGERKFRSIAHSYTITDSLLLSNRAAVAIYLQKDSVAHPAVQLRYGKQSKELTLTKDKGGYSKTPYFDTYHKFEIIAERLHWDLESPLVDFSILNTKTLIPVQLESTNYYSNNRYQQLVGIATFHPLQVLTAYGAKVKSSEFYAAEVARSTKINETAIKEAALNLSRESFLDYDGKSGYIALKPKAWHYVGSSKRKHDYDHLVIKSVVPSGRNATLNLTDNKLTVRGVQRITFNNDTTSVYMVPDSSIIHILANRDIEFAGKIFANRLSFKGSDFKFNYNDFMINMAKLDTIALISKRRDAQSGKSSSQVLTSNQGKFTGKLYINKPNNKSGKEHYPDYPKFDADQGAQVAFARPDVLGGAYDSTVYFDMPPFKVDSLSSAGKSVIGFTGTFHSGGIFPPFKTKLVLMPDETLGFYYQTPPAGLKAYGGKGMVIDTIKMDSKGIQSKGILKYLSATLEAPNYTYYLDSVTTKVGKSLTIGESKAGSIPQATLANYGMTWHAKADSMMFYTAQDPMYIFKERFMFKGTAKLSPGGMYGKGEVDNTVANVTAPQLHFKERSFAGSHAQMIVKSDVEDRPSVKAQDVNFTYDLANSKVEFASAVKGMASIEFPKAKYKTSMSSAVLDVKTQKVSLKAESENSKNYFYSLDPAQGGLRFMAASGEYNVKKNTLFAEGVPHIAVADVYVVPDSGIVSVAADATINTLHNARIMADTVQKHHKLYSANVAIFSRNSFQGNAIRTFHNAAADSFQLVFSDFMYTGLKKEEEKKKQEHFTTAVASVEDANKFYVFPRVMYRGNVAMNTPKKYMNFDGELKLNFNDADAEWFPYKKDTLNPENVRIPILEPKAADGTPLFTGLHYSKNTSKLYNTFASRKQSEDDVDLFVVDGLLSYNKEKTEFKMGREERAYGNSYVGNMMTYNEATKTLHFEGKVNPIGSNKTFKLQGAGSGTAKPDSNRYTLDAFLAFDLTMPSQALEAMAKNLKENAGSVGSAMEANDAMLYKLGAFVSEREVRNYAEKSAAGYVPLSKVSSDLVRSLVLSKVDLQWSEAKKAWYSVGKIGVAGILKDDINATMDGYLELRHDQNGDPAMSLYLQANQYTWYYFNLFENALMLASSDDNFNKIVSSKAKGNRATGYTVYSVDAPEKNQFLKYFSDTYLKGKGGIKVSQEQPVKQSTGNFDFMEGDSKKDKKKNKKNKKEEASEEESYN